MTNSGEHLSVAKALYQLNFYLRILGLPVTVKDLYERAYRQRRGEQFDDRWLEHLEENPEVVGALDEPFTTQTIIEVLMKTGHQPLVRALMREVRQRDIGVSHAYMIGSTRRR
jgi:hypothetical protein